MTSDPDFSKSPIRDTLNPSWYSCIFCTLSIEQLWAHMCKYKMPIFMGHPGGILKGHLNLGGGTRVQYIYLIRYSNIWVFRPFLRLKVHCKMFIL